MTAHRARHAAAATLAVLAVLVIALAATPPATAVVHGARAAATSLPPRGGPIGPIRTRPVLLGHEPVRRKGSVWSHSRDPSGGH